MSRKVKIGVFGARRGMAMIRVLAHHPDAELVAICDQFDHLLKECEKLAQETNTKVTLYKDFEYPSIRPDAVVWLIMQQNTHLCRAAAAFRQTCSAKCCLWRTWQKQWSWWKLLRKAEGLLYAENHLFPATVE